MKTFKVPHIKFRALLNGRDIIGYAINPGGWFGKPLWLIQVAIANALNPFFVVEASDEQCAIDELADSERYGHVINLDEEDAKEREAEFGQDNMTYAGNDSHPVDLDNVHIQPAPKGLVYTLEWSPEDQDFSSGIANAVEMELTERGNTCERCGSELIDGLCEDETCPFSDHAQTCPVGWHGHSERDNDKPCNCRDENEDD